MVIHSGTSIDEKRTGKLFGLLHFFSPSMQVNDTLAFQGANKQCTLKITNTLT